MTGNLVSRPGNLGGHYELLSEQIRNIGESVYEVKGMMGALDDRMRNEELLGVKDRAVSENKIKAAHRRLDENVFKISAIDVRLISIEGKMPLIDDVLALRTKLIVMVFISGFVGTTVAGLSLALLFKFLFRELI